STEAGTCANRRIGYRPQSRLVMRRGAHLPDPSTVHLGDCTKPPPILFRSPPGVTPPPPSPPPPTPPPPRPPPSPLPPTPPPAPQCARTVRGQVLVAREGATAAASRRALERVPAEALRRGADHIGRARVLEVAQAEFHRIRLRRAGQLVDEALDGEHVHVGAQ